MKRILCLLLLLTIAIPFTAFAQSDATPSVEVFSTEDGSFIVLLPEGWAGDGNIDDGLTVANSADTLETLMNSDVPVLESGEFGMVILPLPSFFLELIGLSADASHAEILEVILSFLLADGTFPTVGDISDLTGEEYGFDGVVASGSNEDLEIKVVAYTLAVDTIGIAVMVSASGELASFEDDASIVLGTASYSPALTQWYTNEDVALDFSYPDGWEVNIDDNGLVYVTNDPSVDPDADLESGQFVIAIVNLTAFGLAGASLEDSANTLLPLLLDEGDTAEEPVILVIGDDEIFVVSVDGSNSDGGLILHEHDGSIYAAIYVSAVDEARLVGYIGAAILLSIGQ